MVRLLIQSRKAESGKPQVDVTPSLCRHRFRSSAFGFRRCPRRGVLLLVVLSLLAVFALLLISFVTITNHARRASDTYENEDDSAVEARALLNDAAAQVTRGSTATTSVLFPHSLLEDMYGGDTLAVRPDGQPLMIGGLSGVASGQILNLLPNVTTPTALTATQLQQLRDELTRRVGCVLTVGTGTGYLSFRVVGFDSTNMILQVWNETEQSLEGADQKWGKAGVDDNGNGTIDDASEFGWPGSDDLVRINDLFILNGTPFGGTGFGLNVVSGSNPGRNDATDSTFGKLLALQPNYLWNNAAAAADSTDPFLLGGANEDYDASDYQNMVLAIVLPDGSVIPSLHRPELVNYWRNASGSPWNNVAFRRRVLLRPLVEDNPDFAAVNQAFNPSHASYDPAGGRDVDTDGDGVRDSIWVDLGASVRSKDGKMCKPLFAILCLDLDGRLNLNAHGAVAQTDSTYYGNVDPTAAQYKLWTWANSGFIFSGGVTPNLPRGMGYGPADVNLLPLFGTGGTALTAYANFLGHVQYSRYAPDGLLTTGRDAMLEANKWYEYNVNYWNLTAADTRAYGSPPNRLTDGAIGIDPGGRPLYCGMGRGTERNNDPYKLNLVKVSANNTPFTVNELERLLRQYDADAIRLPARLVSAFGLQDNPSYPLRRHTITTESWDVPCPAFKLPEYLSKDIATDAKNTGNADVRSWLVARLVARRVQDLLAAKYYLTRSHNNDTQRSQAIQDTDTWIRANAAALLPVELLSGRKMDVNRPFGNGRDDNSNNVVDEPNEATTSELLTLYNPDGSTYTVAFNHTDQKTDTPAMARQLYARYLYVLATALIDEDYLPSWTTAPKADQRAARARWIAQWAVNVVDFRDRDSIMTAFEYDPDPLGVDGNTAGWRPDGDLTTDDGITDPHVVWGCERPDLLITETLATHARRVLNSADVGEGEWSAVAPSDTPPSDWDDDFDQTVKPEGSLFIEVYNPWSPLEPRPAEMSDATTGGILLNKTAPGGDPVWRMTIAAGDESDKDPDADDSSKRPAILRSVYFAKRPTGYADDGDVQFETNDPTKIKPIGPGQYGIIGPGSDYRGDGKYITCFGRLTAADAAQDPDLSKLDSTRRIVLDPAATGGSPVQTNGGAEPSAAQIQPVVSVVIDKPHRLNVSHPNDDYAVPISPATAVPSDKPMDYPRTYDKNKDPFAKAISGKIPFLQSGTTPKVAVVYLQRLADPTRAYHATTNPYRTIDSAIVDLVAFNGWDVDDAIDPASVQGSSPVRAGTMMFADNERGTENTGDGDDNLWVQRLKSKTPAVTSKESPETHLFPYVLQHTLGFLNKTYTTNRLTSGANRGDPDTSVAGTPAFPWLTWNNRPFVSPMELLLVPSATSSRLLNAAITTDNVPTDSFGIGGSSAYSTEAGPFAHLMNFARSSGASKDASRLYQLLDLLGVPSPFVGTELQVNATELAKTANQHALYPPFHFGVSYRDPGRINLNTLMSQDVWRGLMNDMDAAGNSTRLGSASWFTQFAVSRRGYTGGASWYATDNGYPTRFANPFRSGGATRLNPLPPTYLGAEVEGTLLRPDPATTAEALLGFDSSRFGSAVADCNNPDRNPFFRYQSLSRLSNLVTTRSNTYAVWITLGYFEVTGVPVDGAHPDGYALGAELGSSGGTVTRHRGFYLIDRSIPVGFVRGQDLNAGNAIRLMRFIE